jgi:hypothetical protein
MGTFFGITWEIIWYFGWIGYRILWNRRKNVRKKYGWGWRIIFLFGCNNFERLFELFIDFGILTSFWEKIKNYF